MTVLIDPPAWPFRGRDWSHLVSDSDYAELHAFAEQLGIPRRGFQGDHYDIPQEWYQRCLDLGAVATPSKELLKRLVAAGLRQRRRHQP